MKAGRTDIPFGLDPDTHAPLFGVLLQAVTACKGEPSDEQMHALVETVIEMVEHIQQELRIVGFWSNNHAREVLIKWILRHLDDREALLYKDLGGAADRLMEVAKANHERLVR